MNTFKFWPVGQGLFYTGTVLDGNFNFVYDCGSNDENYINNCVDAYLDTIRPHNTIDFVVISHLHYDHFSGLYELSQKAKIKKLYLPYLGDSDEIKTLILANAVFRERAKTLNDNLYRVFNYMLSLYRVERRFSNDDRSAPETVFINENVVDSDNDSYYSIFQSIEFNDYWKFSMIAKQISSAKYANLNNQLSTLLANENATYVIDLVKRPNGIDKIKKIYDTVFKNPNPTSIILIHQPLSNAPSIFPVLDSFAYLYLDYISHCDHDYHCFLDYNHNIHSKRNISLLTGDACFDKKIISLVKDELNNYPVFVAQVPHHGARAEWRKFEKGKLNIKQYVISYGLGNTYNHPNKEAVDGIIHSGEQLISVTQNDCYVYFIR